MSINPDPIQPADYLRMVADDVTQLGYGHTAHNLRDIASRWEQLERELAPTEAFRDWVKVRHGSLLLTELKQFDLIDLEEAYAAGQRAGGE